MFAEINSDPRLARIATPFAAAAVALAIALVLRRALNPFLEPDDPRRFLVAQVILYGGTFILVVILLLVRRG